jgi:hypothetical protein
MLGSPVAVAISDTANQDLEQVHCSARLTAHRRTAPRFETQNIPGPENFVRELPYSYLASVAAMVTLVNALAERRFAVDFVLWTKSGPLRSLLFE